MYLETLDARMFILAVMAVAMIIAVPWVLWRHFAASSRRMNVMMTRVGLNPGLAVQGDGLTRAVLAEARILCRRCPSEALCERWLSRKGVGSNALCPAFCPNAKTFRRLKQRRSLTLTELAA